MTTTWLQHTVRLGLELALPAYTLALLVLYFKPDWVPRVLEESLLESVTPWAVWGVVGAMSGVLALSGLLVAFFLLYSPVYLIGTSLSLVGKGRWVDGGELRFYVACFVVLCFLGGVAIWSPLAAGVLFVILAGSAHLLWRLLV
jgi:hypothetical protein